MKCNQEIMKPLTDALNMAGLPLDPKDVIGRMIVISTKDDHPLSFVDKIKALYVFDEELSIILEFLSTKNPVCCSVELKIRKSQTILIYDHDRHDCDFVLLD